MRYEIDGFEDYEIDEHKQVFRKPTMWRTGKSNKYAPACQMKLDKYGKYSLRRQGNRHRLMPEQVWDLRKQKGGNQ